MIGRNLVTMGTRGGQKRWRCRTCFNAYKREYMRAKRAAMTDEEREAERAREQAWRKRPEVQERTREYNRTRRPKRPLTEEQKMLKRARSARYRRKRGQVAVDVYLARRRAQSEKKRLEAKPEPPKVPFEVRECWAKAAPGSMIRRLFPTTADLKNAEWDPYNQTIRRRAA